MPEITDSVVSTMRHPVLVLDQDLTVALANRAFCRLFRVSPDDTVGRGLTELGEGHWDIPELSRSLGEMCDRRSEIEDFRVEQDFPGIGRRHMLLNASCLPRNGERPGILLAIEDVTERERDRHELEAQKELAEKVVDASRNSLLILGWDLRVRRANETFYDTFEVDPDETEGKRVYELGEGQWDIPRLRRLLEDVLPEGSSFDDFEVEHDFPRIGRRTMRLNARRVDHLQLILLAIEDVTDRKRARAALEASEERLRQVLETEAIGVVFYDSSGHLIGANDVYLRMSGYAREDIEAGDLHWRDFTPEEWVAASEEQMENLDRTGHLGPYEKEYLCKDGARSWMLFAGRRLGDGTIVEYCIDISDWKRAERERELLAQELAHRVKNTLGVVQSLATQTGAQARSVEDYLRVFLGRLQALAQAHSLLIDATWQGADLAELVTQAVEAYRVDHPDVIRLAGDHCRLTPKQALGLSLILHELGTNAAKHGALTRHEGRLLVTWRVEDAEGDGQQVHLEWRERHGPVVEPPKSRGFGTELIEGACAYELDGEARMDYAPEGLTCHITFPVDGSAA